MECCPREILSRVSIAMENFRGFFLFRKWPGKAPEMDQYLKGASIREISGWTMWGSRPRRAAKVVAGRIEVVHPADTRPHANIDGVKFDAVFFDHQHDGAATATELLRTRILVPLLAAMAAVEADHGAQWRRYHENKHASDAAAAAAMAVKRRDVLGRAV